MDLWTILGDTVLLLGASLLLGGAFSRFGQSPIVGYLIAGMLLGGPGSIHAVRSEDEIEAIAKLGVALLLFSLGLEFSVQRLKQLGAAPLLGGCAQITLTLLAVSACALAFGVGANEAIALGSDGRAEQHGRCAAHLVGTRRTRHAARPEQSGRFVDARHGPSFPLRC